MGSEKTAVGGEEHKVEKIAAEHGPLPSNHSAVRTAADLGSPTYGIRSHDYRSRAYRACVLPCSNLL